VAQQHGGLNKRVHRVRPQGRQVRPVQRRCILGCV
jgi:hypothetical protein